MGDIKLNPGTKSADPIFLDITEIGDIKIKN